MLRTAQQPIVCATRTVCTRPAVAAVCVRPAVLNRSISTGISKPKSTFSAPVSASASKQQQQQRTMSTGNYNQGQLSTFGFQERQPSEADKQLVEDILKMCTST